jgi:hypothetical protein
MLRSGRAQRCAAFLAEFHAVRVLVSAIRAAALRVLGGFCLLRLFLCLFRLAQSFLYRRDVLRNQL